MKKSLAVAAFAAAYLLAGGAAQALPTVFYSNDFAVNTDNFSSSALSNANAIDGTDLTQFHGTFLNSGTTLTIDLTGHAHTQVSLEFDLYLFGSWDGNSTSFGPDSFELTGDIVFSHTFTNHQPAGQSFPGTPTETFGSSSSRTDVYRDLGPTSDGSEFLIAHSADIFTVTFQGDNLSDESWGIDNVVVTTNGSIGGQDQPVPEPASFAMLSAGLIGLGWMRRRRKVA